MGEDWWASARPIARRYEHLRRSKQINLYRTNKNTVSHYYNLYFYSFCKDPSQCTIALTGVPLPRLLGIITSEDTVSSSGSKIHELIHGVSGFEYHRALDAARTGDGAHVPGACTVDHSLLQVR